MNSKTRHEAFFRTRGTWLILAFAGLLWLALCAWALTAFESGSAAEAVGQATQVREQTGQAQTEAEEKLRLDAQAAAAEKRQRATEAEALEQARLAAEAEAAEQARLAAEAEAAEQTRLAAEAEAAEQARLAAEAEAAEAEAAEAEAAEAEAAEQARLAAEAEAAEQARLAAEAEAAEQARLAAEAEVAEQARLAAEAEVAEQARLAAAAEASRIAALARQQRSYDRYASERDRELGVLGGLSSRLRFAPGSATISRQTERILDDVFNPLYLYSEVPILVSIATNEYDGTTRDALLSRDRGRAIASYLINRGLEKERFRIRIESGEEMTAGTHRVRVYAEEI